MLQSPTSLASLREAFAPASRPPAPPPISSSSPDGAVRAVHRWRVELVRGALLAVVAALIWMAHFDRWTVESWRVPTNYFGDTYETLVRLQAAAEGDTGILRSQVIERLGAPFGAHWNAYPTPDKLLMSALGALVPVLGLFFVANLGFVLAQVSGALGFYFFARWLRCRWEWAWAGALIFSYTYHTFHRGVAHFSLIFTWTVPLGLLAVWLVAGSRRLAWRSRGAAVCFAAAVALGLSNPYNLFFWLQLMAWALVAQILGRRSRRNLAIGLATVALAIGACLLTNSERWLHADDTEARPVLERSYAGTEQYALKPMEMFVPPAYHKWDYMASFGRRYMSWSSWRGEDIVAYLGLAGVAGFCWLMAFTARRALTRRPVPPQALVVGWILAYASIGGVTNLVAMFTGLQVFRATNRAAVFLSVIVVLWLVSGLSRLTARFPAPLRFAAALMVAAIGVLEQLPRRSAGQTEAIAQKVHSDREFGARLEAALGPGAMVFQTPTLDFPEAITPHNLTDYEHFRPYLATDTLRFSYGSPRSRARGGWQRELQGAPPAAVVRTLESYGFAALYLNRKGFPDGGEALLGQIAQLGYDRRIESLDGEQVAVLLRPQASPRMPLGKALTIGRGWKFRADGAPWAYDAGTLSFFNPYPTPIQVELRMTLTSRMHRRLTLELDGQPLRSVDVPAGDARVVLPAVALESGINQFCVRSGESVAAPEGVSNEARAFGLAEANVLLLPRVATR